MADSGRKSIRLFAFLYKADFQREFDRLLKEIEDEIDVTRISSAYTCPSSVSVGDFVYLSAADTVDRASALDISTAPTIGIVTIKPTATTARVAYHGEQSGFIGLTPGTTYFLGMAPGSITSVNPSDPGNVIQKIGLARNATTLVLMIDRDFTPI